MDVNLEFEFKKVLQMPDFKIENSYDELVAGVDEAGRGPLAGPVVAGAVVILDKNLPEDFLAHLDDSKKLTPARREKLFAQLFQLRQEGKIDFGIGEANVEEIDRLNILQATFLAMNRAFSQLKVKVNRAIVDGNQHPKGFPVENDTIVKGDAKSYSIAAASILAKVYRDHYMADLAKKYPQYLFDKNAGYGTKAHLDALRQYGSVKGVHRESFNPVSEFLHAS